MLREGGCILYLFPLASSNKEKISNVKEERGPSTNGGRKIYCLHWTPPPSSSYSKKTR